MRIHRHLLALAAALLSVVTAFATIDVALQMQTGNPSNATATATNHTKYLIQRAQYAMDYNDTTREPNWVAWDLTSGDVGSSGRSSFIVDSGLPAGFYQVLTTDYSGSGYDRGHMCPSADRTVTTSDNQVVFTMTNMVPQSPDNNQGVWASFETYCRTLASAGNELLIISGPSGFAGSTIASGVAIPGYTWKIAVVVPLGSGTALSRIDANTRVITIKVPNIAGVRSTPWQNFLTSAAQIQTDTGYTFFTDPALAAVAATLRAKIDGQTATGTPTVTTQPTAQSAAVGGTATFSVTATGNATLTYQWLKNDEPITGNASATTTTLTLTNVQAADAATYTVVVANSVGTVTSAGAALVITGLPPGIATSPASRTSAAGTTATFNVSATGSPTLTYQWRKGTAPLANGGNVSGATTATLILANVQSADTGSYDVVVSNSVSPSATSAAATLTITAAAPTIITAPAAQTTVVGNLTTFSVAAAGTAPFTYQWRKGGTVIANGASGNGSTFSGATTATLTLANTQLADAGSYDVVVANGVSPDATSTAVALTVSATAAPSTVNWDFATATPTSGLPSDVTGGTVTQGNNNGTTTMLSTTSVSSGYTGASGTNNAGASARTGVLNTAASGSAYFEFTLTPAANKQLTVSALSFGSRSTSTGPQAFSIFSSADNYASALATGTFPATSTWVLYSPTLTSVTSATGTAVTFRLYGHSGTGSASASTANWRIDDLKVTLTTTAAAPTAPAVTSTSPLANATGVNGTSPITVTFNQPVTIGTGWFSITSALTGNIAATVTGGPTTFTFTPPVNFTDNDTVTVTLFAAQITDQATATLHPAANTTFSFTTAAPVAPGIATAPTPQTANAGATATFTVVASGTAPFTYQWRKAGVAITGNVSATTATLTLANVQSADQANYDVVISNGTAPVATSTPVALTVTPTAPTITTAPVAATVLYGNNATFTVAASGTTPFSYQWRKGGVNLANGAVTNAATVSGATSATLTLTSVTSADTGSYDVIVTNSVSSATSTAVSLTVNLPPAGPQTNYSGGTYAQNFDTLPNTGTFTFAATGPYDLSAAAPNGVGATGLAGWSITKNTGSGSVVLFKFDTGSSSSGGLNSYGSSAASDRALGSLGSGTFAGRFGVAFVNNTGTTLTTVTLGYTGEQWRNGGSNTANKITFSYATGATDINIGTFTTVNALTFTAPIVSATSAALDGNLAANRTVIAPVTLTGLSWAPGQTLVLRWTDVDDAGSDDGLAIDDFTFTAAPAITTQPAAQIATSGGNASFTVATSASPVTYQWRKNGAALTGNASATTATLTLSNVTTATAGAYDCIVTNAADSTNSAAAGLTVNRIATSVVLGNLSTAYNGAPRAASVTTSPSGIAVGITYNGSATAPTNTGNYAVAATVTDPEYVGSATGTLIIAKGTATIILGSLSATYDGTPKSVTVSTSPSGLPVSLAYAGNATPPSDAGSYVVASSVNTATYEGSTSAILTITPAAQTVTIGALPATVAPGTPFTLAGTASSGLPVTFSLVSGNATVSGNSVTVADTSPVTLRATQSGTNNYTAASTDITFAAGKLAQTITFAALADQRPTAAPLTLSATASSGLPVTFSLVSGPASLNGATLTLAGTTGTVVVRAAQAGNATYNPAASLDQSFAVTAVTAALTAPAITTQPAPQVAQTGGSATFTVAATGNPAPTYQWRKDGIALAGATAATLTLANVTAADSAGYDVVVTNSVAAVTSSLAHLTVNTSATAPVITRQPGSLIVLAGRSASFTVVASGAPAPAYQWSKNGAALTGATSSTLALASVTAADAGNYSVVVTNSAGSVTSATAALRVNARSFAGYYFGTITAAPGTRAPNGGAFALLVREDNTGVFLGYERVPGFLDDLPAGGFIDHTRTYLARDVAVADDGSFAVTATSYFPNNISRGGVTPVPSPPFNVAPLGLSVGSTSLSGTISPTGVLTARGGFSTSTFAASRAADMGVSADFAGFYTAGTAGSASQLFAIVGPGGSAFVVALTNTISTGSTTTSTRIDGRQVAAFAPESRELAIDSGLGTVDANGRITLATLDAQAFSATLSTTTGALAATLTDPQGAITNFSGFNATASAALAQQRIVNLSTRTTAGIGDQVAIVGFVITGLESKPVLIRAVGPALRALGVSTALAAPRLDLRDSTALLATNTGWTTAGNVAEIANAAARSGAFPLAAGSADSVILTTLAPGTYSAVISAADAKPGVGLVEIYDLSGGSLAQKLANLSTRAAVGSGEATLISGLVIGGTVPKRVLLRAAGPSLTQFGVPGALARPSLALFSGNTVLAQNTGWSASVDSAAIAEAATRVGAFPFAAASADSALIVNLSPGAYTAQVTGAAGTTGITLLEVYELP